MFRTTILAFAFGLCAVITGCDNDPAEGKPQAKVTAAASAAPVTPPTSAATYTFSNEDSKIAWVGAKVTRKHDGAFETFTGTIQMPAGQPEKGQVSVSIDTASITSDEAKLTAHLKSPDFFDVEKFPKATFTSTDVKAGGEGEATHTITGNLDLHGNTKAISFPATIKTETNAVKVQAEFAIDRKDFSIVYPGMPDDLIKDEVLIKLNLNATSG